MSADGLRELWEDGVEHEENRGKLMDQLNHLMTSKFRAIGTASVWTYGFKDIRHKAQLNVDDIEMVEDA